MAPSVSTTSVPETHPTKVDTNSAKPTNSSPLSFSSPEPELLQHEHFDSTVVIGTEFSGDLQLASLLSSDTLLRDIAVLVSQRGVVFFRKQKITIEEQKLLGRKLGQLSGGPPTSGLHIHPLTKEYSELGDQISVIDSATKKRDFFNRKKEGDLVWDRAEKGTKLASAGWHADITFEKVPSNYAILKIHTQPHTGGDTIWASGYEVYDRLSPAFRQFLSSLTAVHNADRFNDIAERRGFPLRESRGAPENVGTDLTAVHPVIRVNPVTGWKSVFVNQGFTKRILGVTKDESDRILDYLFTLVRENHDLQVRFKWKQYPDAPDHHDVAIWENRSVYHTATDDYFDADGAVRTGDRVVSLGEKPYYAESGKSRRDALGLNEFAGQQF